MENNIEIQQGERLSFFQLFNEKKWKVEIPIIQRDYAQGRKSTFEIRQSFLNTLYDHLLSGINIDLDFVYGSLSEHNSSIFIPLDGQQRLTTLFLLHWYLSAKDIMKQVFLENFIDNMKSKFTYETRASSREFCDALVISKIEITNLLPGDKNKNNSLSTTIKDSSWYFSSWDNDPTIQSMLVMLDAIHLKFRESKDFFKKLIDIENPVITFQFLNIEKFKLTDDLYIKMNARGKQLTPFENFKAKFEQFINDTEFINESPYKLNQEGCEREVSVIEYFSHKIDTDWANLFWNYRDEKTHTYDNQMMNFIRVIATNYYALKENNEDKLENLKLLIGKDDPERKDLDPIPISFYQYNEIDCFDESFIIELISNFELITNGNDKIKLYLTDNFHYNEEEIFEGVLNNSLNYTQRVRFFAFYHYIIFNKTTNGLSDWMRVIYNLSENTIYNKAEEYARSIKSIEILLPDSLRILDYLVDFDNPVSSFLALQVTEERIKAILFQKSKEWIKVISEIEKHEYFKGQISYILNFSGIEEYCLLNKHCNWSGKEDKAYLTSFKFYSEKSSAIFDANGLIKLPKYIWERTLLSKGDYLLPEGSNFSFLIDNDRDIGWKRLLRDDNDGRRLFVKEVFDDVDFDVNDVDKSLNKIRKKESIDDWRKYFIEFPEIICYLGYKKYVRWGFEGYYLHLIKKERMSGPHAEYYSYAFLVKFLQGKENAFLPFKKVDYYEVSGEQEDPCAYINSWVYKGLEYELDIYFDYKKHIYELYFHESNNKPCSKNILPILQANDLKPFDSDYVYSSDNKFKILKKINSLCDAFQKL